MTKFRKTLFAALLSLSVSLACSVGHAAEPGATPSAIVTPAATMPADIEEIMWWFPEDTETVFAARSTKMPPTDKKSGGSMGARHWSGWQLSGTMTDKLGQIAKTHTVQLSVEGSRHFRPPAGLGLMPFEGCEVVVVKPNSGKSVDLMNLLPHTAKKNYSIAGNRVALFIERHEQDTWKTYVASPRPNLMLIATNENFLVSMLYRMKYRRAVRAFPANLPEWKYIDFDSFRWAIRHFDRKQAKFDPTSPFEPSGSSADKQAIGLAFNMSGPPSTKANVFSLSRNPQRQEIAKRQWVQQGVKADVTTVSNEAVRIETDLKDEESTYTFMFFQLGYFGHAIYL